jgi:hypothetical protein
LLFKDDLEGNVETFFCVGDELNLFDVLRVLGLLKLFLGELPGVLFIVVIYVSVYTLYNVIKNTLNHITCCTPAVK